MDPIFVRGNVIVFGPVRAETMPIVSAHEQSEIIFLSNRKQEG